MSFVTKHRGKATTAMAIANSHSSQVCEVILKKDRMGVSMMISCRPNTSTQIYRKVRLLHRPAEKEGRDLSR